MTSEVIDASEAALRHLVLFMVIGQPDLTRLASTEPSSVRTMYRDTAARETLHRRELLLGKLRERGILTLDVPSTACLGRFSQFLPRYKAAESAVRVNRPYKTFLESLAVVIRA